VPALGAVVVVGSKFTLKTGGLAEIWFDAKKVAPSTTAALTALGKAISAGWKAKMSAQSGEETEASKG
jgi:hypothetical protein